MNRSVVMTAAAVLQCVVPLGVASAQAIQVPKSLKQAAPQIGELLAPKLKLLPPTVMSNQGDAATAWVSPVLSRHDGRISGEVYTVNGVQVYQSFGLTIINPDTQGTIEVALSCYRQNGTQHPSYTASLRAPRLGAASWDAGTVVPERSTDRVTADQDQVWCLLLSDKPFVAFGTRSGASHFGSDRTDVTLVPIAR